jgi:anti-sigma regulatory factor (Ser/Thr protein kinase)
VQKDYEIGLQMSPEAARRARRWIEGLQLPLASEQLGDLVFLANELVTNSVIHSQGRGEIALRVVVSRDTVRVEVIDPGDGPGGPQVKKARLFDTSGRGLGMVGDLANRWGWHSDARTNVWFEIDARAAARTT